MDNEEISSPDLQVYCVPPNESTRCFELKSSPEECSAHTDIPETENVQCILSRMRSAYAVDTNHINGHALFGPMAMKAQEADPRISEYVKPPRETMRQHSEKYHF